MDWFGGSREVPTRLEGMETRLGRHKHLSPTPVPTRLEGMETAEDILLRPHLPHVPTRLEGMETAAPRSILFFFLPVPTRLEGMETARTSSGCIIGASVSRPDLRGWKQLRAWASLHLLSVPTRLEGMETRYHLSRQKASDKCPDPT